MRLIPRLCIFALALCSLFGSDPVAAQVYSSQRVSAQMAAQSPYNSVGVVQTRYGRRSFRGSAAVAQDPRLLYSCAHLVYDYWYGWASRFSFKRGYSSFRAPTGYVPARGYVPLQGYEQNEDFDLDFVVAYGGVNRSFGPQLSTHPSPRAAVEASDVYKMIVGYPADLDHTWRSYTGYWYMHQTGPFTRAYVDNNPSTLGGEYRAQNTTTGRGNSGGPLLVWDGNGWNLAGILVSGSDYSDWDWWSGVYVLGSESVLVARDALGFSLDGETHAVRNSNFWAAANPSRSYVRRSFDLRHAPPQTLDVSLDLSIYTGRRGDLDVFVRSPRGRVHRVTRHTLDMEDPEASRPDLILAGENLSGTFADVAGRGTWSLFFRDMVRGNPSSFFEATLTLRSRWPN